MVCDPLKKLAPSGTGTGIPHLWLPAVEAQGLFVMVTVTNFSSFQTQAVQPVKTELFPVSKPFQVRVRAYRKFSSICSNSRVRNVKLPGAISLRKDFPTCPIPKGSSFLDVLLYIFKVYKIPCAVSGLK